jgi:hypothetical protein
MRDMITQGIVFMGAIKKTFICASFAAGKL